MDDLLQHRWVASDREINEKIMAVQAEMNGRGLLVSSIAVKAIHEVFGAEFESSRSTIVQTVIDSLSSKKVKFDRAELEHWAVAKLAARRDMLDGLFSQRAKASFQSLQNEAMIAPFMSVAQYYDHATEELKVELSRALDAYEQGFGATVTDRVVNGFKNRPVVAFGIVVTLAISSILGLVAFLKEAGS